jgi:hypothetical protein
MIFMLSSIRKNVKKKVKKGSGYENSPIHRYGKTGEENSGISVKLLFLPMVLLLL